MGSYFGRTCVCLLVLLSVFSGGCHEYPDVFFDETPPAELVTTMSAERARQSGVPISNRKRTDFAVLHTEAQDGCVSHGPLWFSVPGEMIGSDDGQFAITAEDHIARYVEVLQLSGKYLFLPFLVMLEPPGTVMCSDGRPRRSAVSGVAQPYDQSRCSGETTPIDNHETWIFDDQLQDTADTVGMYGDEHDDSITHSETE